MKQLQLFNLPDKYNYINEFVPMFAPKVMDKLVNLTSLNWRKELLQKNFELKYKLSNKEKEKLNERKRK